MQEKTARLLARLIPEIRIKAKIEVMVKPEAITVKGLIHQQSATADLVILGLATPAEGEEEEYAQRLSDLAAGLPSLLFVHNGSLFIGELVSPKSGNHSED